MKSTYCKCCACGGPFSEASTLTSIWRAWRRQRQGEPDLSIRASVSSSSCCLHRVTCLPPLLIAAIRSKEWQIAVMTHYRLIKNCADECLHKIPWVWSIATMNARNRSRNLCARRCSELWSGTSTGFWDRPFFLFFFFPTGPGTSWISICLSPTDF